LSLKIPQFNFPQNGFAYFIFAVLYYTQFFLRKIILRIFKLRNFIFMDNPVVELRSRLGISQEEAAMLLGISRGHHCMNLVKLTHKLQK